MSDVREIARLASRTPGYIRTEIEREGVVGGLRRAAIGVGSWGYVNVLGNPGEPVWNRDWDVLCILDACRVDLMQEVAREYPFVGADNVDTMYSVASMSNDWLQRTFSAEFADDVERTAYVTGNPFTAKTDLTAEPAVLDEVWKYAWDDEIATVPARPITDRAIETWRERPDDVDRMIVHYMQPHAPFVNFPELGEYGDPEDFGVGFAHVWPLVGDGTITYEHAWRAYRDNLRYVLDDVSLLLSNLDADTVALSADHGNAIGEWNYYGHPADILLGPIRRVPWVVTGGTDTGEYEPTTERPAEQETTDEAVAERLRNLGYAE